MFSGLVTQVGTVIGVAPLSSGVRLTIQHEFGPLELGESIMTSGACLTVVRDEEDGASRHYEAELSVETLERTTLGTLVVGSKVNLERSVTLSTKLGGHLVTGHVDGKGRITSLTPLGEMMEVVVAVPEAIAPLTAEKGSLTVEGVSLTINRAERASVTLLLVPHTRSVTTLGALKLGQEVNLEADLVARYVARLLEFR
jgi:riboflavin synthase